MNQLGNSSDDEVSKVPLLGNASGSNLKSSLSQGRPQASDIESGNASSALLPPPPSAAPPAIVTTTNNMRSPTSSRPSSRAASPMTSRAPSPTFSDMSDELPNNVSTEEQLKLLPAECLSGDTERPLRHIDEMGLSSHHALQPMVYSVIFILLVELLERFSFYGINYTQTSYLTGAYDERWNAGMEAVPASSYVSISTAVAYTAPFLGAILADSLLGDYWSIIFGSVVFYLPGLFLIALTTVPHFLGRQFNRGALAFGLLFMWPVGTGIVKSVVNVFGAKQFHPLLQASLIESYYVKFYMCINIGALIGGVLVPLWAERNVTQAYFIPVVMLSMAVLCFMLGTPRYVRSKPKGSLFSKKLPRVTAASIDLYVIFKISMLIVPFCIAYSQMATTFIVQGTVMRKAFGFIDAACMNNADAVAVLVFGYAIGEHLYPWLAQRGIKIPTTYKFAIGSAFGTLSIGWALVVDHLIRKTYRETGKDISIMWQALAYILIGAGEIFAVSAAYEVAFTASPPEKKVLASAMNLFAIGGVPSVICIALYQICRPWFENSHGTTNITRLEDYSTAHIMNYFWLLFWIAASGVLLNLLPAVKAFVESIEEQATDMIKSPKTPSRPPRREEESPLLRIRRHHAYLKYGSGPQLYKSGSMRAGPFMSKSAKSEKHLKRSMISKLYRNDPVLPGVGQVISQLGKPIMAGALLKRPQGQASKGEPHLRRTEST